MNSIIDRQWGLKSDVIMNIDLSNTDTSLCPFGVCIKEIRLYCIKESYLKKAFSQPYQKKDDQCKQQCLLWNTGNSKISDVSFLNREAVIY